MPTDELVLLTAGIFSCPRFLAVDHAGTHHADNNAYAADDRNPHGRVAERQSDEQTDHNARNRTATMPMARYVNSWSELFLGLSNCVGILLWYPHIPPRKNAFSPHT